MAVGSGVAAGAQAARAIIPTITMEKTSELLFIFSSPISKYNLVSAHVLYSY
jgi:hypothetical protein